MSAEMGIQTSIYLVSGSRYRQLARNEFRKIPRYPHPLGLSRDLSRLLQFSHVIFGEYPVRQIFNLELRII